MTRFDADECAKVLVKVDNDTVKTLEQLCGRDKDTGWQTYTFSNFLSDGGHTIMIGSHNNKKQDRWKGQTFTSTTLRLSS